MLIWTALKNQDIIEINNFFKNIFERGAIPLINKSTKVTTKTVTIIHDIL